MSSTGPRTSNGSPYTVLEEPLGTPQHLRVVMIGGGASGLNVARHMKLQMENYELQIYEKNEDVGGTWFENRYERIGVALDYNHLIGSSVADILAVLVISPRITTSIPGNLTQIGRICEYTYLRG